jgi:hypothetical protein
VIRLCDPSGSTTTTPALISPSAGSVSTVIASALIPSRRSRFARPSDGSIAKLLRRLGPSARRRSTRGAPQEVHRRRADEAADERVARVVVHGERRVDLHDPSLRS